MNDPFGILAGGKGAFCSAVKVLVPLGSSLGYVFMMMRDKITVCKILRH